MNAPTYEKGAIEYDVDYVEEYGEDLSVTLISVRSRPAIHEPQC